MSMITTVHNTTGVVLPIIKIIFLHFVNKISSISAIFLLPQFFLNIFSHTYSTHFLLVIPINSLFLNLIPIVFHKIKPKSFLLKYKTMKHQAFKIRNTPVGKPIV